jgi:hypothetical protein
METGATAVVGRGLVEILPDFKKWGKQLAADMRLARTQLDGSAAGLKASAATVGKSMAVVGKGTTALGLGVAAVSVKIAADFQAHTAVLQTAAGETSKGLAVVRAGIKNIAVGTGTGIQNLTDGMYTIEKAGFRGSAGLQVLRAAAQGAREENAKLSDVTNAMTSIMASYHLKATDSVRVMNAMKTAAGEGKITMEEFSGALSTVLPIASANKISFQDVAGSMATLTQHGTSAREATHELAATIRALASPNMVASREMARWGLSAVDVSRNLGKRGLSGTVNLLTETILKGMGPAGIRLQKTFEGTKQSSQDASIMLQHMTGDQKKLAQQYLKGNMLAEDWNSTIKGMPVASQPALRNFKVLVDRSRGFSRELKNGSPASQTFTDALKKMSGGAIGLNTILQITGESAAGNAERIKKVGASFHNSSKDVEGWKVTSGLLSVQLDRMKAQFQVLAINIGTKLIPVVSAIVGLFAKHQNILLVLAGTVGAFIAATSAAYIAMKLWAVASGIATAAMFVFNVATLAETDSLAVMRGQLALLWVQERLVALWTAVTESAFWGLAAAILANPITWIVVGIAALVAGIVYLATKTKFFQTVWGAVWGTVKKITLGFVHWLKDNWQLVIWSILTGGIGLAVAEIVRHWDGVKKAFSAVVDFIKHHWTEMLATLGGPMGWAVLEIVRHWGAIKDGAVKAFNATLDFIVKWAKNFGSFFSKLPGELGHFFSILPGIVGHWLAVAGVKAVDFVTKLPARIVGAALGFNKVLTHAGGDLISGLWKGATDFFTKSVPGFFKMLWHGIVDFFKNVFGIHSPSTVMSGLGINLIMGLLNGMLKIARTLGDWEREHIFKPVINFFKNAPGWLTGAGKKVISGLLTGALAIAHTINDWIFKHVKSPVIAAFRVAAQWLVSSGRKIISGMLSGASAIAHTISDWFTKHVKNVIVARFNLAVGWLKSAGHDVIGGMFAGFASKMKDIFKWAKTVKNAVVNAIVSVFKISSPSRVMLTYGIHIMAGLLNGMIKGKSAMKTIVKSIFHSTADVLKRGGGLLGDLFSKIGGSLGLGPSKASGSAQQYAQLYMRSKYGWSGPQWSALKALWNGESGWNYKALNRSSGAYGIPQSLPGSKMASAGSDWRTNPATQIKWGLSYIKNRYGSPASAYSAWLRRSPHWYDSGGIARGVGAMLKGTLHPERVLSPRQTVAFEKLVGALTHSSLGGSASRVTTIERLVVENHGVIGSRHETENWLVDSLDQLKRRGRI